MICQCGADKNKTRHSNECPVTLGLKLELAHGTIEAQRAVIKTLQDKLDKND